MVYKKGQWYFWRNEHPNGGSDYDYIKYFIPYDFEKSSMGVIELFPSAWESGWALSESLYEITRDTLIDMEGEKADIIGLVDNKGQRDIIMKLFNAKFNL